MHLYLPIASLSLSIPFLVSIGFFVGIFSGLLGVSGGFLLTPLLILIGTPAPVAVGTVSCQTAATSLSGALTYLKKGQINFSLGFRLLAGSILGAFIGIPLFHLAEKLGVLDLLVAFLYFGLLSFLGGSMIISVLRTFGRFAGKHRGFSFFFSTSLFSRLSLPSFLPSEIFLPFLVGILGRYPLHHHGNWRRADLSTRLDLSFWTR